MAFVISRDVSTIVTIKYVEQKQDGSFQYRRRIPSDLQKHYDCKRMFVKSLQRDKLRLSEAAFVITSRLDQDWLKLRKASEATANDYFHSSELDRLSNQYTHSSLPISDPQKAYRSDLTPSLSNSVAKVSLNDALYLSFHDRGEERKFRSDLVRTMEKLVNLVGNLPLEACVRDHAEAYRDRLLKTQSSGTVRRNLTMVCAIFNRVRKEKQLQILNPFDGLSIPGEGKDERKRVPFTAVELRVVSLACRSLDDDIRHIMALQLDTGARLGEIVGLRLEDVILDHPVPHIRIRPFGAIRTLKTPASERDVPLMGEALWAAERALQARRKAADSSHWLFPRYATDEEIKATHASNTLNKWLKGLDGVSSDKTTHCFRHSMRDRLRAAQVPLEIQDVLGGWGSRSVGQGYGSGYPLHILAEHLKRVDMQETLVGRC